MQAQNDRLRSVSAMIENQNACCEARPIKRIRFCMRPRPLINPVDFEPSRLRLRRETGPSLCRGRARAAEKRRGRRESAFRGHARCTSEPGDRQLK